MPYIDSHLHLAADHPDSIAALEALDISLLNICVTYGVHNDFHARERDIYNRMAKANPERFAWITTFNVPQPGEHPKGYAKAVIDDIERDIAQGAVACKVWKNVGMDLKDASGKYMLVDDPIFEPIFTHLEQRKIPLLMHIAEPLACWRPIEEVTPHQGYYRKYPQWHMFGRTDVPDHTANIAAQDNVIGRHPRLSVIGAHLGSLEYSLGEMTRRFQTFPNYAMDTSARLGDLASFATDELRAFLIEYQDRVLFGTDVVSRTPHSTMPEDQRASLMHSYKSNVQRHVTFFGSDLTISINGGEKAGVNLPDNIFKKIMCQNTLRWYPALAFKH